MTSPPRRGRLGARRRRRPAAGLVSTLALGAVRPGRPEEPDLLNLGGTLAHEGGSLRAVLDAALSSPSGRGVVVDDDGRLIGTVTTAEVVELIEEHAAASRASHLPAEAGT